MVSADFYPQFWIDMTDSKWARHNSQNASAAWVFLLMHWDFSVPFLKTIAFQGHVYLSVESGSWFSQIKLDFVQSTI